MRTFFTRLGSLAVLVAAGAAVGSGAATALAGPQPNPPMTAHYSIKGFIGGTKKVILAIYPPTHFTDNTPIPAGADMKVKIYRSYDAGKTYGPKGVTVLEQKFVEFINPETGQARFDPARTTWIEVVCETPVDPPKSGTAIDLLGVTADGSPSAQQSDTTVYLAAAVVVDGVESAAINRFLTFRYAVSGIPGLVRYLTPDTSVSPPATQLARVPAAVLADRGGLWEGEYVLTAIVIADALRKSPQFNEQGCQQALAQIDAAKNKETPMTLKVTSITNAGATNPRGTAFHPGTADVIMPPIGGKGQTQTFKSDLVYFPHRSYLAITDTVEQGALEMMGDVLENATEYEIEGPFRFRVVKEGQELLTLHGVWRVKRKK